MPEYLAPGVYVEEVNTGNKPIEGVSTSTTGLVGVTERGPENVPVLVTSTGSFSRVFGGQLDFLEFTDSGRTHAYLPHSVEGFFTNGGRRAYIVRVLPESATHASRMLFDRGEPGSTDTVLLRGARQGSGTLVNTPFLYVLNAGPLAASDFIRIGDGSRSEYRQVANVFGAPAHVSLSFPLGLSKDPDAGTVDVVPGTVAPDGTFTQFDLVNDVPARATSITVSETTTGDATALQGAGPVFFEIGTAPVAEYIRGEAVDLGSGRARITLEAGLALPRVSLATVRVMAFTASPGTTLATDANGGDLLIYPDDPTLFHPFVPNTFVQFDDTAGGGTLELRRIGELARITLDLGAYTDYPERTRMELVTLENDSQAITAVTSQQEFDVTTAADLVRGMVIDVNNVAQGTIQSIAGNTLTLTANLGTTITGGEIVTPVSELTADADAGSVVLSLANRLGLDAGDVLRLGVPPDDEYVTIAQVTGPRGVAPDAGTVVISAPLRQDHNAGVFGFHQTDPVVDVSRQPAFTILPATEDATELLVNDGTGFGAATEIVRITTPGGAVHYHRISAAAVGLNTSEIELASSLEQNHEMGAAVVEREPLLEVRALDRGAWGNRLLVSVEDEEDGLASRSLVDDFNPPLELNLTTLTGVEAGTVLELVDPATDDVIGPMLKVRSVDRASNNLVELDPPGLDPVQITALNNAQLAGIRLRVRSREFALTVFLLERPHPAVPTRNEDIQDLETYRHLSMDHRHSRYVHRILGTTWTPPNANDDDGNPLRLSDLRSEGESTYVRVRDQAPDDATAESIRLGPEALEDVLPSGRERAARHRLGESFGGQTGTDAVALMDDAMYEGDDDNEPRNRTGIFALKNIQDISLVAVPGQTTPALQQALIDHCEGERYRFAVLDAQGPDDDTLADVQFQRQQFDTKYAALYHPWLTIPEPMPLNLSNIRQVPIPPSGHVLGIYADTDNVRGVHKAPANAVVGGITGLTRSLNRGEHEILNPFPVNINVIRDFREDNRGLRVWGARVITSDTDYKYVNVRRLLIFLEASIDRGLQWVVFEPNAEELWARVRRAISNFLTVVWRNGALEGTSPQQAFFVKCDRTTMTQTDIDNGRLICVVGVAPVKPAEFVIVRIGLWTANAQA